MVQRTVYIVFHNRIPVRVRNTEPDAARYIMKNALEQTEEAIKAAWKIYAVVFDDPQVQSSLGTAGLPVGIPQVD